MRRVFYAAFTLVGLVRWLRPQGEPDRNVLQKILLVRVDLLGDVIYAMAAADALRDRYPTAHIAMLTLPHTAALARLNPSLDEVVALDTNRIRSLRGTLDPSTWLDYMRILRRLRSRQFDLCISLYGRMGSLCAFLSGAKRSIGYAAEAYPLLLSDPVSGGRHQERLHEVEYVRRLARYAGAERPPDRIALTIPEDALERARRLLNGHGISDDERLVVIHPGAVNGSAKRWPEEHWARLAETLSQRESIKIVLIGAEIDRVVAERVLGATRADISSLVGSTDLPVLAAVLARANLVVSGDSGPLHLAVALGRPLVAIYGPTDPRIYGPHRPATTTIIHRADLPCSPCYSLATTAECPLADPICMRLVSVGEVVKSALEVLRAS
jgi:lipopolysaccharide heptosyltransferase II